MKSLRTIVALISLSTLPSAASAALPSIFCCGDSTVKNSGTGTDGVTQVQGWGTPLGTNATGWSAPFDSTKCTVKNVAHAGTSATSYYAGSTGTNGDWTTPNTGVLAQIQPGDYVLIVFGINFDPLSGNGDGTIVSGGQTVHSYGWYLREMCIEARNKGAHPYLLTLTCRVRGGSDGWTNPKATFNDTGNIVTQQAGYTNTADRMFRGNSEITYTEEAGAQINVPVFDLHVCQADYYEAFALRATMAPLYSDHNHTYIGGAQILSKIVLSGLRSFKDAPFDQFLSTAGKAIPAADRKYITDNLAVPARPEFILPARP